MTELDPNAWLMRGAPSAKFPVIGTRVEGEVVDSPILAQQTDMDGKPKTYDDSKQPMMHLVIRLQTSTRDPEIAGDDGIRAIYVKGQNAKALRDAVRAGGGKGIERGGYLVDTYTADGEKKGNLNPAKLHSYQYTPPSATAANAFLNSAGQPATAEPVQQAAPPVAPLTQQPIQTPAQPAAAPAPTADAVSPEHKRAALRALGIDPSTVGL